MSSTVLKHHLGERSSEAIGFAGSSTRVQLSPLGSTPSNEAFFFCKNAVSEAGEMRLMIGILVSGWFDCTHDIKDCHGVVSREIEKGMNAESKQIRLQMANWLHAITMHCDKRYNELVIETKAAEAEWWDTRAEMRTHFHEFLIERVGSFSRYFSCHTTISMSIVLSEMMVSLGWNMSEFTVTSRAHNRVYVCEVVLQSKEGSLVSVTGRTVVKGAEEITKVEAIERGAEAAILYLEKNLSIFLVDINYKKRSKAKLRLEETQRVKQLFSTIISEVKAE